MFLTYYPDNRSLRTHVVGPFIGVDKIQRYTAHIQQFRSEKNPWHLVVKPGFLTKEAAERFIKLILPEFKRWNRRKKPVSFYLYLDWAW